MNFVDKLKSMAFFWRYRQKWKNLQRVFEAEWLFAQELGNDHLFRMQELRDPFFYKFAIKPWKGQLGVFATQEIKKGDPVSFLPLKIIPQTVQNFTLECQFGNKYQLDFDTHLSSPILEGGARIFSFEAMLNHCCYPQHNIVTDKEIHCVANELACYNIATKDIAKDEQLTMDYACFDYKCDEVFECCCGSENCRKTVSGFAAIPREQQWKMLAEGVVGYSTAVPFYMESSCRDQKKFIEVYLSPLHKETQATFYFVHKLLS